MQKVGLWLSLTSYSTTWYGLTLFSSCLRILSFSISDTYLLRALHLSNSSMTTMVKSKSGFDPAEHLAKQGWKGKGTGELRRRLTPFQLILEIRAKELMISVENWPFDTTSRGSSEEVIDGYWEGSR